MIIDRLRGAAVTATGAIQGTERLLFFGVDTEHRQALRERQAPPGVDVAKLLIALDRVDDTSDQLLAQLPAAKTGLLKQHRRRVAADPDPLFEERPRDLHWVEVAPAHPFIGRTASRVSLEHGIQGCFQLCDALHDRRPSSTRTTDPFGVATRTGWILRVALVHLLQFLDASFDCRAAHAQNPCHIRNAAIADLQCFHRCIATAMVFWQRAAIQAHHLFMRRVISWKVVHGYSVISV